MPSQRSRSDFCRRGGPMWPPATTGVRPCRARPPGRAAFPSSIWRAGQCPAPTKGRGASAYTVGAAHRAARHFQTAQLEPHQPKRRASNQEEHHTKVTENSAAAVIDRKPISCPPAPLRRRVSLPNWRPRKTGVQGPTPLIKGRWPKARGDRDGRI